MIRNGKRLKTINFYLYDGAWKTQSNNDMRLQRFKFETDKTQI